MKAQLNPFCNKQLAVAGALLLLSACSQQEELSSDLAANLAAPYDYFMNGMHTIRYNANGERSYLLSADRVTHFPDDDHAELMKPDLLWYQRNEAAPWTLVAETGNLHHTGGEDELSLNGNVKLNTTLATMGAVRVETSQMNVMIDSQQAHSDAGVVLTTPSARLQSKSMQLSLPDNHVTLSEEVRGTHAP